MWCVTPLTRDSGPLRVIPGSHRRREPPIDTEHGYATGMGPHPGEVKIIAPAGSVILFNAADLWHSGPFNYTPAARLAITAHFDPGRQPGSGAYRTECEQSAVPPGPHGTGAHRRARTAVQDGSAREGSADVRRRRPAAALPEAPISDIMSSC